MRISAQTCNQIASAIRITKYPHYEFASCYAIYALHNFQDKFIQTTGVAICAFGVRSASFLPTRHRFVFLYQFSSASSKIIDIHIRIKHDLSYRHSTSVLLTADKGKSDYHLRLTDNHNAKPFGVLKLIHLP